MAALQLSKVSKYEQTFKTRHRPSGRPTDIEDTEPLFPAANVHPVLADVARRRAYALVHHENRGALRRYYQDELKVLERRGVDQVAADSGKTLVVAADSDAA